MGAGPKTLPLMEVFDGERLLEVINFTATLGFGAFHSDPQTHGNKRLNSIWTAMPPLPAGPGLLRNIRKTLWAHVQTFCTGAPPQPPPRPVCNSALGRKSQDVISKQRRELGKCFIRAWFPCNARTLCCSFSRTRRRGRTHTHVRTDTHRAGSAFNGGASSATLGR